MYFGNYPHVSLASRLFSGPSRIPSSLGMVLGCGPWSPTSKGTLCRPVHSFVSTAFSLPDSFQVFKHWRCAIHVGQSELGSNELESPIMSKSLKTVSVRCFHKRFNINTRKMHTILIHPRAGYFLGGDFSASCFHLSCLLDI